MKPPDVFVAVLADIPAERVPKITKKTTAGLSSEISVGISPIISPRITLQIHPGIYLGNFLEILLKFVLGILQQCHGLPGILKFLLVCLQKFHRELLQDFFRRFLQGSRQIFSLYFSGMPQNTQKLFTGTRHAGID